MASPFARFRKRQKFYLAILGVMCMFAFVFLGIPCNNTQGPGYSDPVVVSTKYGELHQSRLDQIRANQDLVNRFLQAITVQGAEKRFQLSKLNPQLRNLFLEREFQQLAQEGLYLPDMSETTAVDNMILARKAEDLGVVVSDEAIRGFIRQRTSNSLSNEEIAAAVSQLKVSPKRLFEALRMPLMALRMRHMFGSGLMAAPPGQQWDYYQRLNRRAKAEIVPVSVASFVDQVSDPPEETLRRFFEENKQRIALPGSPEPGFKQPHKIALQYLRAEYDKFYSEAAVSDEEIQQHYDKNTKNYPYSDPPLELSSDEEPAEKPTTDKPADPPEGTSNENPEEEEESVDEDVEQAAEVEQSNDQPPVGGTTTQPPVGGTANQPPAADDPEKPAVQSPEAAPAATATQPPAKETEKGPSLLDLSANYGLPRDIRGGPKPEHAPFWSVKDRIRRELAGQQARKKMEETLAKAKSVLEKYYTDLAISRPDNRPHRPDFLELAKKHGLSAHEITLASLYDVITETELGQAVAGRGPNAVKQALESTRVFAPYTVQDTAGNHYLYWKTSDVPEHVPSFEDPEIRSEVLAVWKQKQARDLARKRAEELAQTARAASEKPLAEVFAEEKGVKVTETPPFTWMTQGNEFLGPQEPQITNVPGVETPGPDFMRTVFDLSAGDVGVAFNAPQTEVYVVRVTSVEPSPRVLMEKFLAENPRQQQNYFLLARDEIEQLRDNWYDGIRDTAGLHWKREPYSGPLR